MQYVVPRRSFQSFGQKRSELHNRDAERLQQAVKGPAQVAKSSVYHRFILFAAAIFHIK